MLLMVGCDILHNDSLHIQLLCTLIKSLQFRFIWLSVGIPYLPINFLIFMSSSITGFSNLLTNESNERKFVYQPSNSEAN